MEIVSGLPLRSARAMRDVSWYWTTWPSRPIMKCGYGILRFAACPSRCCAFVTAVWWLMRTGVMRRPVSRRTLWCRALGYQGMSGAPFRVAESPRPRRGEGLKGWERSGLRVRPVNELAAVRLHQRLTRVDRIQHHRHRHVIRQRVVRSLRHRLNRGLPRSGVELVQLGRGCDVPLGEAVSDEHLAAVGDEVHGSIGPFSGGLGIRQGP